MFLIFGNQLVARRGNCVKGQLRLFITVFLINILLSIDYNL